jgi:hypothetical protein
MSTRSSISRSQGGSKCRYSNGATQIIPKGSCLTTWPLFCLKISQYDRSMKFDWQKFLDANHVDYAGPDSRGNVTCRCPFCGSSDWDGNNMSISLTGRGWHCWRTSSHKGVRATRLVQMMLNCSWQRAVELTGEATFNPVENLTDKLKALYTGKPPAPVLEMPIEFKMFSEKPSARPYARYLRQRGLWPTKLPREMLYATRGDWAGRIIFPVRCNRQLIGWTGRTIYPSDSLRYKDGGGLIKNYLPWYDELKTTTASTLVLTEGPFDAVKVQYLGRRDGITSTCFFTAEPSQEQLFFLQEILPRFDRCVSLLDRNTLPATMRLQSSLRGFNLVAGKLPANLKDAAEFSSRDQLLDAICA